MSATAISHPNIALIKYWGNRNNTYRLPAADSLSMTLNQPEIRVEIQHADTLQVQSTTMGTEKILTEAELTRTQAHIDLMKEYLTKLEVPEALPVTLDMQIKSSVPPSIGLASSAAVFSAIAKAVSKLISPVIELTDRQISILARLGAGSASRSIFGGYATLHRGEGMDIDSSYAEQIHDENHWKLYNFIVVPSQKEKEVKSTEGHALAPTSPHFIERIQAIETRRQEDCTIAIRMKDFERLQCVAEEDALDMHHIMSTSTPSLQYLSEETHRIINEVQDLRHEESLPVLYTMDAGPTVHLFCLEEATDRIREYAEHQKENGCTIFESHVGPGAS